MRIENTKGQINRMLEVELPPKIVDEERLKRTKNDDLDLDLVYDDAEEMIHGRDHIDADDHVTHAKSAMPMTIQRRAERPRSPSHRP